MSKYTDWSPASVFGSTVSPSTSSMDTASLQGALGPRVMVPRTKASPKKRDLTAICLPQNDLTLSNNEKHEKDEERRSNLQHRRNTNARAERERELAALLVQRQVQVWLWRRQETMRLREVQRLRGELRQAAAGVLRESYRRCVKRRAISRYLHELGDFETRLDALLQSCVHRKRQMEKVQRFANLRRQQKQAMEDRKRKIVHDWLALYIRVQRKKREQATARANVKFIGWMRRWRLRKRCEVRAIARQNERQQEAHRRCSALAIVAFYQAYKLCREAKKMVQHRRRVCDGLTRLYGIFRLKLLRDAQSRWLERARGFLVADTAALKLQQIYRGHQAAARYARVISGCLVLQRVLRGYHARVHCINLQQCKIQEAVKRQRYAAATVIQRNIRGRQTRQWFNDVLSKLRERFWCANCGTIEPGGAYCKYCGHHRTTFGLLSTVLLLHEKWQLGRSVASIPLDSAQKSLVPDDAFSTSPTVIVRSPMKPTLLRSQSASLRVLPTSSSRGKIEIMEPLNSLPVLLSPRHRRLIGRSKGGFTYSKSFTMGNLSAPRRNSIASISEQTAQRAAALVGVQAKFTASTETNILEMHLSRLQKGSMAATRGTTYHQRSLM